MKRISSVASLLASPALIAMSVAALTACSMDIVPVSPNRVKSAQYAQQPLKRGQGAPGAFSRSWKLDAAKGLLFDPSTIEMSAQGARLKAEKGQSAPAPHKREAVIVTADGFEYDALDSLKESVGPAHRGQVRYQLSKNSSEWFYFDGKKWVPAGPTSATANSVIEVNQGIAKFHEDVGNGRLVVKAFLISPTGAEPVELKEIAVQGVVSRSDGWD